MILFLWLRAVQWYYADIFSDHKLLKITWDYSVVDTELGYGDAEKHETQDTAFCRYSVTLLFTRLETDWPLSYFYRPP